jgi:hypothetical protein
MWVMLTEGSTQKELVQVAPTQAMMLWESLWEVLAQEESGAIPIQEVPAWAETVVTRRRRHPYRQGWSPSQALELKAMLQPLRPGGGWTWWCVGLVLACLGHRPGRRGTSPPVLGCYRSRVIELGMLCYPGVLPPPINCR